MHDRGVAPEMGRGFWLLNFDKDATDMLEIYHDFKSEDS